MRLPDFTVVPEKIQHQNNDKVRQRRFGSGRTDFGIVFRELKRIGVKRIMEIEVEDLKEQSHADDIIIDSLKDFNIKEWDWRKLDLCTEVIRQAAQHVRKIRLYSSGNNAVLCGWSGKDGLQSFGEVGSQLDNMIKLSFGHNNDLIYSLSWKTFM